MPEIYGQSTIIPTSPEECFILIRFIKSWQLPTGWDCDLISHISFSGSTLE